MKKIMILIATLALATMTQGQVCYDVTHVHDSINTSGSETAVAIISDSVMLYTTMSHEKGSSMYLMQFGQVMTQINQAPIRPDGSLGKGELCRWGFNASGTHCGNVAYDRKNQIAYFTRSESRDGREKKIYYSCLNSNGYWSKAKPLGGDVNQKGYTSTHPAIGYLSGGEPILYFASDRPGGLGGMDIWYTVIIKPGMPGNCTNLGAPVNTDSNEVTPFYCDAEGALYFSSNRPDGLGGYDVYRAEGRRNAWAQPQALDKPISSPYDDVFFMTQPCSCRCPLDTTVAGHELEACGFLASNRPGSLFKTDSNCCNDLFRWRRWRQTQEVPDTVAQASATPRTLSDLLPLTLYFHNDEPDSKTLDTTTRLDYSSTWKRYMSMRDEYKGAQPSPVDRRKWDSIQKGVDYFFDHQLKQGHDDLRLFLDLLYLDLKGSMGVITITVNGFASPLFESEYNVNLSKRRIDCFRNELLRWNDGALAPYLSNGSLRIVPVANGAPNEEEVSATDPLRNPHSEKSVYSMDAARSRRIEIINYQIDL